MSDFYSNHKGRCIGRLMFFLYKYSSLTDRCTFDGKEQSVYLNGKLFAKYTWDEDSDIPTFEFLGEHISLNILQSSLKPLIIKNLT
jgi:hypothetical protein